MEHILKRAWAEINLENAKKNLKYLCDCLDNEHTEPVCVIKANAYGHGDVRMMELYQKIGINYFAVSNINEAERLRDNGCIGDILILSWSPADKYTTEALHKKNIIQTVVSYEHAKQLSAKADAPIRIHIKLDTGMGRVGLDAFETEECVKQVIEIAGMKNLNVEGIFTHFAVADSLDTDKIEYTELQKSRFFDIVNKSEKYGVSFIHKHFTNSAGALLHNDKRSTLARFGITLYGLTPDKELNLPKELEPVMNFKAVVSQVKTIHKGQTVSYGRTYTAEKDTIVATIPVGYADGYPRLLSNRCEVLINGKRAREIGRICMDQMMVDVTNVPGIKAGDIVTLIGRDGDEIITADDLAEIYGTIGYEVVCGISSRVPRVYI